MAAGDGRRLRLRLNATFNALVSLFSALYLINMAVMAIHSDVISCHINTYISGTIIRPAIVELLWIPGRLLLVVLRMELALALIHEMQEKGRRDCFIIFAQTPLST